MNPFSPLRFTRLTLGTALLSSSLAFADPSMIELPGSGTTSAAPGQLGVGMGFEYRSNQTVPGLPTVMVIEARYSGFAGQGQDRDTIRYFQVSAQMATGSSAGVADRLNPISSLTIDVQPIQIRGTTPDLRWSATPFTLAARREIATGLNGSVTLSALQLGLSTGGAPDQGWFGNFLIDLLGSQWADLYRLGEGQNLMVARMRGEMGTQSTFDNGNVKLRFTLLGYDIGVSVGRSGHTALEVFSGMSVIVRDQIRLFLQGGVRELQGRDSDRPELEFRNEYGYVRFGVAVVF